MTQSTLRDQRGAHLSSAAGKPSNAARRDGPAQPYPGEKARQGRIVLDTPARRSIFIAGLIGAVLLAFAVAVSV